MRLSTILAPTFFGLLAGVGGPPVAHGIHAWLYPTPEQVAAQKQAEAEHHAQQVAAVEARVQSNKDEVNSHLTEHPGCKFEDLGGYTLLSGARYPIFAIFCPAERVSTTSVWKEEVVHHNGKTTSTEIVEHPETVTTDPTGEEQPQ